MNSTTKKSSTAAQLTIVSDLEGSMTRVFDAPRELVFKAFTDPKAIPHWWGPRYLTTVVDKMDVRQGGTWRFVQRDAQGNEYAFRGEYREVAPPKRLVNTFEFEAMAGHIVVETVVFEEVNGKTKVTATSLFQSIEARDGMLQHGMEEGAVESWDRLAEHLAGNMAAVSN